MRSQPCRALACERQAHHDGERARAAQPRHGERREGDVVPDFAAAAAPCRDASGGSGKSMPKPRNATIMPPAMRMPGIEMPKKLMIRLPATRKLEHQHERVDAGTADLPLPLLLGQVRRDRHHERHGTERVDDGQDREQRACRVAEDTRSTSSCAHSSRPLESAACPPRAARPACASPPWLLAAACWRWSPSRSAASAADSPGELMQLAGLACIACAALGPHLDLGLHRRLQGHEPRAAGAVLGAAPPAVRAVAARDARARARHPQRRDHRWSCVVVFVAIYLRSARREDALPARRRMAGAHADYGHATCGPSVPDWSRYPVPESLEVRPRVLLEGVPRRGLAARLLGAADPRRGPLQLRGITPTWLSLP